jgi:hypothetical protein
MPARPRLPHRGAGGGVAGTACPCRSASKRDEASVSELSLTLGMSVHVLSWLDARRIAVRATAGQGRPDALMEVVRWRILAWYLQFRRHRRESDGYGCAWRDRRVARYAWCLPVPGCPRGVAAAAQFVIDGLVVCHVARTGEVTPTCRGAFIASTERHWRHRMTRPDRGNYVSADTQNGLIGRPG